ncbi:MAG: DNA adenine methylase [Chthoniobacterales bacterium]
MNLETYRIKPAVSWPGGKSKLLKYILPLIPKHTCYVEPFAGGLAVLLAKPRSQIEVLNDLNGDLVTFYRCVRFHADTLLTELEFVLNSRKEFFDFADQPGLTDIQRASRWFFRHRNCFRGASLGTFGVSPTSTGSASGSRSARMESIRELNLRMDRVIVENMDWKKCLDSYDRPTSFFFLDPPYTDCAAGMYAAWTITDVQAMKQRLDTLKGKWMVTLNDSPAIRRVFAGCRIQAVTRPKGIGGKGVPYNEIIVTAQ